MRRPPTVGLRPCRIIVLDIDSAHGFESRSGAPLSADQRMAAWRDTVEDLQGLLHVGQRVDLFGMPQGQEPASESSGIWRFHDACGDLTAAVAHLGCDANIDVAWVRAGTRLPRGWPLRLQQGLHEDDRVGHLAPLHLDDPWLSPLDADLARGAADQPWTMPALSDWLGGHAPSAPIELGAMGGQAGLLRGQAAVDLVRFRGDASLSAPQRLASHGWACAFSRRLVVWQGPATADAAHEDPRPSSLMAGRDLWRHAHPLMAVRHACREIWPAMLSTPSPGSAQLPPPKRSDPEDPALSHDDGHPSRRPIVRLHVAHSWGGGLSKWVRDFVRTDQAQGHGTGLVLRSVGVIGAFGQRLSLYAGDEDVVPLRFWELGVPIHATAAAHLEVQRILQEIIEDFGVEQVIVSSLIGHSLDVLRTGLPTLLVAHDHHPFCIALYAHFEGECRQCDGARLRRCVEHNPGHRFFQGVSPQDWLVLRESFIQTVSLARLPIVAPSASVAQRWQSMMPALDPGQFRIIEHGVHLPVAPDFEPPEQGPLRLVVLGRISPEKGSALLMQMLPDLLGWAELVLVGCGEPIDSALRHPRITVIPEFANADLPAVLAQARPHLGLMMSTVPETFSYALTELWHAGIPVLATDSGALADRVEPGVSGFLVKPEASMILSELHRLEGQRDTLAAMRQTLRRRGTRTLQAMLQDYEALLPHGQNAPQAPKQSELASVASSAERAQRPAYQRAIQVNPEVTWSQAARGFWQFTCLKASRSPKLAPWLRRWFAARA